MNSPLTRSSKKLKSVILRKFHYGAKYDPVGYVTSAGTCSGDSGGPLYVETRPGQYVVTGLVSGGRGYLGKCGGINNPVHYVRLQILLFNFPFFMQKLTL